MELPYFTELQAPQGFNIRESLLELLPVAFRQDSGATENVFQCERGVPLA
ncbi:hypothetical protein LEP1GSC050_4089 [Leptospira broomii serovar Hurstbridge str. 5399]|uniref:Uncharacterized protein n=1 Tax=Leptospira broomii serovar Hurstbridge str. 5399 TaxID=1049789 RepID=T0F8Y4_9LEPT|nr:hypothetical protein LEP1GSC050_4089 [Leptospira broomii serovar Hurstbridge str. 5399]